MVHYIQMGKVYVPCKSVGMSLESAWQGGMCGKTLMVGWVENKHTLRDLRRCT
jgi:hypothetical protein